MSQNVTFLSLCSLTQIHYFQNDPNVSNIECNTVCEFRMVMSQNVTFLSLCSLIQIHYFQNDPNAT